MQKAIIETFNQRKTGYDNIAMFEDGFETDTTRQNRWNTFVKKKKVLINEQFQKVLKILKDFLFPIIKANKEKRYFLLTWNANDQKWS